MSIWSRISNAFTPFASDRLNRELDEEYEAHIAEAIASGRDPEEARRSFGPLLRHREASRQYRVASWLESLRTDLTFGLRQLKRNKVTSAAAILSLGLAMGSCVGAFRLIDALLWRPLPIAHPERLYALWHHAPATGAAPVRLNDDHSYPEFLRLRSAAAGKASLIAASYNELTDLTYSSDAEMEKASVQNVSGSLFGLFGLQPAVGRLLTENDDRIATGEATGQPAAVISHAYWTRRFGRDPRVLGATVHIGERIFQIVGVVDRPFTGVEPGTLTDIFLPATATPWTDEPNRGWLRIFAVVYPGTAIQPLARQLEVVHRNFQKDRSRNFHNLPQSFVDGMLNEQLLIEPASAGVSMLQMQYKQALGALCVLVILVLLIACVNVANLMTAQAAARAQEMALRVSIGAGRLRLVQLVLAESALLALGSALVGGALAWWSAPFVVSRIDTPNAPAHLILPADWRVALFAAALIVVVMLLFGLLPALRASSVRPVSALKGGDDPHARKRLMHGMIAAQVAFCFLVVFFAGIFVTSAERLSKRPIGFDPANLLLLETVTEKPQPAEVWEQVGASLRPITGVESEAISGWSLLEGGSWNGFISVHGAQVPSPLAYYMTVSPGWLDTMKIQLLRGRSFRPSDLAPGTTVVSETFAKTFFPGEDPLSESYSDGSGRYQVVGVVHDAAYRSLREDMLPVAYVPFRAKLKDGKDYENARATFAVRLHPGVHPEAITPILRKAIAQAHAGFRVSNLRTQQELIDAQTVRERMLAMLAFFFAGVALLLAGIGLFGVLQYTVLQRRREIGIRIAIGSQRSGIAGLVARPIFAMIVLGGAAGVTAGILAARSIETLFYATKATDAAMLTLPAVAILSVAVLAVIPAIRRAIQTDPAEILRAE